MKQENRDIDQLTRQLMAGTAEAPSSSLNLRIMSLIMKEQLYRKVAYVHSLPNLGALLGWTCVYVVAMIALGVYIYVSGITGDTIAQHLAPYSTLILTLSVAIPFFFLCVLLDKRLKKEYLLRLKKGQEE